MSEMDSLIVEARKLGQSWQEIANMIPGKTAHMIRKRYNAKLKPKVTSGMTTRVTGSGTLAHICKNACVDRFNLQFRLVLMSFILANVMAYKPHSG